MREVKQSSTGSDNGLSMFLKFCNQFTEAAYLQCIVCTVWLCSLINKAQLEICFDIYKAQETSYLHS